MAERPIFRPVNPPNFVEELMIRFEWHRGLAISQVRKCILSLHSAAKEQQKIERVLEISTRSPDELGRKLSAFNLEIRLPNMRSITVESAYQGSKVFQNGKSFSELYNASSKKAKTDERLRRSGSIVRFRFLEKEFEAEPKTAFYDWLYILALYCNPDLAKALMEYDAFSDISFNPRKSINCQARSAAMYVALWRAGELERITDKMGCEKDWLDGYRVYQELISGTSKRSQQLSLL
jgi:hypothetical protein